MSSKKPYLGQKTLLGLTVKSLFLIAGLILILIKICLLKSLMPWAIAKNLSVEELDALSDSDRASNFFHVIQAFGNKLKLHNFVNIWMVEDRVQNLDSVTCGIFQLYFYDNLFNWNENSKIPDKARLNKRTIETLLNELYVFDDQETNQATI